MRLSTPLFTMPPVTQSVQKPTAGVALQREGVLKPSQLRGLKNSIPELSTLRVAGEYVIGTLTNGQTIKVQKKLSRTTIESELRRRLKLLLHHNVVPTQGLARP